VRHYETVRQKKGGTRLEVLLTVSPIIDSQGRMIGISAIARDITERKRAEEALRGSEDKLWLLLDSTAEAIYGIVCLAKTKSAFEINNIKKGM